MFVKKVIVSLIKNSRRERTVQIELETYEGKFKVSAPSGKSKGKSEVASYNSKGIGYSLKPLFFRLVGNTMETFFLSWPG